MYRVLDMRTNKWTILLLSEVRNIAILKSSSRWKNNFKWECWLADRYVGRGEEKEPGSRELLRQERTL